VYRGKGHAVPRVSLRKSSSFALLAVLVTACAQGARADSWTQPTPEELSMTSQPQVPGAAAVYLYREEITDDSLHMQSYYVRLKVLRDDGKKYADVRLSYASDIASDDVYEPDFGVSVTDVAGRTIHSDGTVVPFTGKPYQRVVERTKGLKVTETVFTLPDVEVGSILEYRYKRRIPDEWFSSPHWDVQLDLYLRKGHFVWKPTSDVLHDRLRDQDTTRLAYSALLPKDAEVKDIQLPGVDGNSNPHQAFHQFELSVHDVAPQPQEDYMPPVQSFTDRVNFYYAVDTSQDEYWKNEGNAWAKDREHFIGSPGSMRDAAASLVAAGDTDTVKLQKIYAAIMTMDNTSFSRAHESIEDHAAGLKEVKTVQDIWQRKRGDDDELTLLFIALARSAGLKAFDMLVTNRDSSLFSPALLSMRQLNDDLAIVMLDGKEQYFDPGQRDCPFGQLAWKHTGTMGLREVKGDTAAIATTPMPQYTDNQTRRIGDLTMDAAGAVTGTVKITWAGSPALRWRQQALRSDEGEMKRSMSKWLEERIPTGLDPEVTSIENLEDYEKPLTANFKVHGQLAVVTPKRLVLPGEFFEANSKPLFPSPTRTTAIYFEYAGRTLDAVRVKFPPSVTVELVPKLDTLMLPKAAAYQLKADVEPNFVQMNRTFDLGSNVFLPQDYPDVRTFYNKLATDDQQSIVLTSADAASGQPAAPAAAGSH
jgi:hypothetical protein